MENVIHGIIGSLHILAVITWIGSMIYSMFAVTPVLNSSLGNMKSHALNGLIMKNFTPITWTSLVVLIATGFYAVLDKKDKFNSMTSGPGAVLTIKLLLVAALIIILLFQMYRYGPEMKQLIMPSTPKNMETQLAMSRVESITRSLSWWHLSIGVTIVILGVILSQLLG